MSYLRNTLLLIIFMLFTATFTFSLFEWFGVSKSFSFLKRQVPGDERGFDEFDPSLGYINSMAKLENYVDRIYRRGNYDPKDPSIYPELVEMVIRKRFYHGPCEYGPGRNYVAAAIGPALHHNLDIIVLPEDIMKYPYAICSQQSSVMMTLLRRKGYDYRNVGFQGHYAFEIKYDNKWHFFDPNMEPDAQLLNRRGRPGIAELVADKQLLFAAYNCWNKDHIAQMFRTYYYKKANAAIAPNATIFQRITYVLSYSLWLFFLVAYVWVSRLSSWKKRRYEFEPQPSWYFNPAKFKSS